MARAYARGPPATAESRYMTSIEDQYGHLERLISAYRLPPGGDQAVRDSYEVFRRFHGPFITSVSAQMLPDLERDASRGSRIVFLGRDGHSFAAATRALAPDFYAEHCREVVLSRVVAETAVQDLERNRGSSFPEIAGFRGTRSRVKEEAVTGSYRQLTAYLRGADIPVGRPDSRVTLVDSSFKGTVQELLAASYERTYFQGRYAFFGAAPGDTRPETKQGYVVHLAADQTGEGKGYPFDDLHPDVAWTFASKQPINAIEDALNGPMDTPLGMSAGGPEQRPQRDDPESFRGFNPTLVPEHFRDPLTREAIKAAALLAVYDAAAERSTTQRDAAWLSRRMDERAEFTAEIRLWTNRDVLTEPHLKTVLDSVVRRVDHPIYSQLQDYCTDRGLSESQAWGVWQHLETLPDRAARADFVREMTTSDHGAVRTAELGHPGAASEATRGPLPGPAAGGPSGPPETRAAAARRKAPEAAPKPVPGRPQQRPADEHQPAPRNRTEEQLDRAYGDATSPEAMDKARGRKQSAPQPAPADGPAPSPQPEKPVPATPPAEKPAAEPKRRRASERLDQAYDRDGGAKPGSRPDDAAKRRNRPKPPRPGGPSI